MPQQSMFSDHWQNQLNQDFQYYIEVLIKGEWCFLWKPHQDYDDLVKLSQKGRKLPFRFLTTRGAVNYAATHYKAHEWKVKNFNKDTWKNG